MSLDVSLTTDTDTFGPAADLLDENGFPEAATWLRSQAQTSISLFEGNITHNLNEMADAAGIRQHLWRPEAVGITHARQLIEPLRQGLERLKAEPAKFKALNPANGWGDYGGLVKFVERYLAACLENPNALVSANR